MPAAAPSFALDHLVVAARTLDEASAWCERTLGATPVEGGRHAGIGTHNRLLGLGGGRFGRSYLELIAVDPDAAPPSRRRWFDLDDARLQRLIGDGPRLVHWVARSDDIDAACAALRRHGLDPGVVTAASRQSPRGVLGWRISRRDDGGRLAGGAVPLVIAWGDVHPCDDLADSGVAVERLRVGGVDAALAQTLGVERDARADAPPLSVRLKTPRGVVDLDAPSLAP